MEIQSVPNGPEDRRRRSCNFECWIALFASMNILVDPFAHKSRRQENQGDEDACALSYENNGFDSRWMKVNVHRHR